MTQSQLMKVPEVADRLQMSVSMVYRMARDGRLPATRFGRSVRIPREALQHYIENNSTVDMGDYGGMALSHGFEQPQLFSEEEDA